MALAPTDPAIDSVCVRLTRTQPPVLAAGLFSAPGTALMSATSTARQVNIASFTVGTTLAALDGGLLNAILGGLLGTNVNLTVLDYNGLLAAHVTLGNLMLAAGVTDLNHLLSIQTTLPGALQILGTALSYTSDVVSQTAGSLISNLGAQSFTAPGTVNFGDILGTGLGTALNPVVSDVLSAVPFVNGGDLLLALAQDAASHKTTGSQIFLPAVVAIPSIGGAAVFLNVITPPVIAVGPVGTVGKSAQLRLEVRTQISDPKSGPLGAILGALVQVNLGIDLTLADGTGTLTRLTCPTAATANPSATIAVTSDVAALKVGSFSGAPSSDPPVTGGTLASLLGGIVANVYVDHAVPTKAGKEIDTTAGPFTTYDMPTSTLPPQSPALIYNASAGSDVWATSSNDLLSTLLPGLLSSLTSNGNLHVSILFIPIDALIDPTIAALNTVLITPLTQLLDLIINPLLQALGVTVGGVRIDLQSVTIGSPVIETFCSPTNPIPGAAAC